MNYETNPDIDPQKPLTPDAVCLFQRFLQDADQQALDGLLETEVERHLKLCELAILYYARCSYYWCELPHHPIRDACEETNVAYGAMFGPDVGDVAEWEKRAVAIVGSWNS